jgi:hypothetical protein
MRCGEETRESEEETVSLWDSEEEREAVVERGVGIDEWVHARGDEGADGEDEERGEEECGHAEEKSRREMNSRIRERARGRETERDEID